MSRRPQAEVTHAVPGRMRLRLNGRTDAERDEILGAVRALGGTPGVESVRTDERTGSALLTYDPEELNPEAVLTLLREAHDALADVAPPRITAVIDRSLSSVAGAVEGNLSSANRSVLHATHGVVDLRMLTPITLGALSLRQLLRYGPGMRNIPWYVLAYYSFDTFIKLHGERVSVHATVTDAAAPPPPRPRRRPRGGS